MIVALKTYWNWNRENVQLQMHFCNKYFFQELIYDYRQPEREYQQLLHESLDLHHLWRESFDFGNFFDTEYDPFHDWQ